MEPEFWHNRWQQDEIGFHEGRPNELLVRFLNRLRPKAGARIFVPLCGKSADLPWIAAQGFHVVGVELSPLAAEQFFTELATKPEVTNIGRFVRYVVPGIEIFQGDVFDLSAEILGKIDAVYDRAALIALPRAMRERYAGHLAGITANAPQLLITLDYEPITKDGPPFSLKADDLHVLYDRTHMISMLHRRAIDDRAGTRDMHETAWLLETRID